MQGGGEEKKNVDWTREETHLYVLPTDQPTDTARFIAEPVILLTWLLATERTVSKQKLDIETMNGLNECKVGQYTAVY